MEKKPSRPFQVVLDINAVSYVMRNVLNGILRFVRDARDWSPLAIESDLVETFSTETPFDGAIVNGLRNARRRFRRTSPSWASTTIR